ncbi:MAG: hypothetical protein JNL11_03390 [Bdellovibrionaceae bacterium]|nr:hypothetical protein [Pseudobdellovibrionaceae bacterium]
MKNNKWIAPAFYFGTLISSVGSLTFNLCMIAFMLKAGFSLGEATLILGLQRLIPAVVVGIWGHITDRLSPRPTVIVVEILAALLSVGLLLLWKGADTPYALFAAVSVLRAIIAAFQAGSRVKITKLLADDSYASNSKHAIWFNKATQGATLFSGLTAVAFIKYLSFEAAIIFDAATFILNGIIIFLMPIGGEQESTSSALASWHQKFSDYFKFNPKAAKLDLLLAIAMMGTVAFQARVAGLDQSWTALFSASYGLAVWSAGFWEKGGAARIPSSPFWILLGIAYIMIGAYGQASWVTVGLFFLKDLTYWMVLHRISGHIQTDTPATHIGGVTSARMTLMILILSTGEILVGTWSQFVPLWLETVIRCALVFGVATYLMKQNKQRVGASERANF